MADLPEIAEWTAGIYQLETSDPVLAGPDGIDNLQAKQLANRTRWLKDKTDSLGASIATKASKATTLAGYGIADAFTKPETTSAIQQAIASLVASSPAALDTLKELADALGNDPNFATTMTNALAGKASKATTLFGYGITDAFTKPETTSAIQQAIASLVASSPAALDTLKELADALGNDPNFATTMTNALAGKASKATTLGGYGINDAYTKAEVNALVPQATELVKGIARVATQPLVDALADDQTIVTPLKLAPLANKVASLEGRQVFTKVFVSPEQIITEGGPLTIAHGLGVWPVLWESYLVCKEAEYGYWPGAVLSISSAVPDNAYNLGVSVVPDASNLNCKYGTQTGVFFVLDWNTRTTKIITPSKWRTFFKVWA
ncbi:hypothetical protein RMI40_31480 [Pseudomonas protegens]|uniref:hypothetical protein n=1 Tax=Pseudomonas protegens TaxID=380021 RepID=UPI00287CB239|nr:hypothetical protein [Pseudomonas protegens]MDS9879360.1 hypothetical protein [Pseudomonas protegens]